MMVRFVTGFGYLATGLKLIRQPGLRLFALGPILINVAVFVLLGIFFFHYFSEWFSQLRPVSRWADVAIVQWLTAIVQFLFIALLLLVGAFTFTIVANIIGAPFNSLLAEQVERSINGQFSNEQPVFWALIKSVPKTLLSELRKILYLIGWLIPIGLMYLVPGIQLLAPLAMLIFSAWVFALEYLDYPMGNHDMGFKEVKKNVKKQKSLGLGFGSAVAIITAIPVLNLIAMPVAVAGATALYCEHMHTQSTAETGI